MARTHIPFHDLWNMRIEVPYSGLVIDGDRAWSTGMLALDADGDVLHPAGTLDQARVIVANAQTLLDRGGLAASDVSRIVLYSAHHNPERTRQAVDIFAAAFGRDTLIETVPVPQFHYDGVLIEADFFCGHSEPVIEEDLPGGGHARVKRESGLILMNFTAPVDTLGRAVGGLLAQHKLSPDQLLSGWGIAPEPALSAVPGQIAPRLPGFFAGALMPCYMLDDRVHLYLTFGEGEVDITESRDGRVRLHLADAGHIAVLDGRYLGGAQVGLEEQTRVVMDGLTHALAEKGMDFSNVVKSTAFYAGKNTPEEMHANMSIRNAYYTSPGPASTGVPIARMADPGSKVRVELILRPNG